MWMSPVIHVFSHVTRVYESCHIFEWVMSQMGTSTVTNMFSHVTRTNHITHTHDSCHSSSLPPLSRRHIHARRTPHAHICTHEYSLSRTHSLTLSLSQTHTQTAALQGARKPPANNMEKNKIDHDLSWFLVWRGRICRGVEGGGGWGGNPTHGSPSNSWLRGHVIDETKQRFDWFFVFFQKAALLRQAQRWQETRVDYGILKDLKAVETDEC